MTAVLTNLAGQRFGNLMVVKMLPRASSTSAAYWKCSCSCGGWAVVSAIQLLHGARKSCGCITKGAKQMQRVRLHRERLKTRSAPANPTLAERIALALAGNGTPITAEALNSLFSEVADALLDAEQEVTVAQVRVLDPTVLDDRARTVLDAAIWRRDKLQGAVEALRAKHQQVVAREQRAQWHVAADVVSQKRDELTEEFASTYPELVAQLIELFQRVKEMDQEVDRINGAAPNSEGRRLLPVGVRGDIALNTRLVGLSGQQMWPVSAPILPEQVMPQLSHPGNRWFDALAQRDAERHRESQRVAAYYQNQQEQREKAEAKARRGNGASP